MKLQDARTIDPVIVYSPRYEKPGGWFAMIARHHDAHKPLWARRLSWWPVSERAALEFLDARQRQNRF